MWTGKDLPKVSACFQNANSPQTSQWGMYIRPQFLKLSVVMHQFASFLTSPYTVDW